MLAIHTTLDDRKKLKLNNYYTVRTSAAPDSSETSWSLDVTADQPNPHLVIAHNNTGGTRELSLYNKTSQPVRFICALLGENNSVSFYAVSSQQRASMNVLTHNLVLIFVEGA